MSFTDKNIYELLPAWYRVQDEDNGSPLKALVEVIARETGVVQDDIGNLYKNWFIETCQEWVVPYIGDLLGVRNLHAIKGSNVVSQRAYVANTISYRRRKGIAPLLEQLSLDIAGWRGHVTEFFQLLATTQYMNHIRLQRTVPPDLRKMDQLDTLNTGFDTLAHTADVRHISSGRGRYNISNIGLYIWRLQAYPITRSSARKMDCASGPGNYFTFSPLGYDTQLFNRPQTETSVTHISEEINVPGLLRRRILYDELDARRQALAEGNDPVYRFFDDRQLIEDDPTSKLSPVFEIFPGNSSTPVDPKNILICNLSDCCSPPDKLPYQVLQSDGSYLTVEMAIDVAVDPVLGRFVFTDSSITSALVSYAYGFSGDVGGGPYARQGSYESFLQLSETPGAPVSWQVGVSKEVTSVGAEIIFTSITDAINAWHLQPSGTIGIITILDNYSYTEHLDIIIKEKSSLLIIAANWPKHDVPDTNPVQKIRVTGELAATALRPHIQGNIKVTGSAAMADKTGGNLGLNGLLIEGKLSLQTGNLGQLSIMHCTLVPANGGLDIVFPAGDPQSNQWLTIDISQSITGTIALHDTAVNQLTLTDSIIDGQHTVAIDVPSAPVTLHGCTVFGTTAIKTLNAENSIFSGIVKTQRRQEGCLRFCFVPADDGAKPLNVSETPRKFHCQPDFEITTEQDDAQQSGPLSKIQADKIKQQVQSWLVPGFSSTQYNDYNYAQLSINCPEQISSGADDGAEMGAWYNLKQPQRLANLQIALEEYLPLGLEAGLIFVT